MAASKKYVVAPGYSFTVGGIIYVAGDVISENVFSDKKLVAKYVSQKKLLPYKGSTLMQAEEISEESIETAEPEASKAPEEIKEKKSNNKQEK